MILGFGVWAPVAFVGLQAGQVVLAPVPGQVVGVASGYLFGALRGTAYSTLGVAIGSAVAVALSRRYGRPYVERVIAAPTLERFDDAVETDGRLAVFVLFLLPGLPDDAICFLAGLTDIPVSRVVALTVVGRLPSLFLVNLAGARLVRGAVYQAVLILLAVVAVSLVAYALRDQIAGWLARAA